MLVDNTKTVSRDVLQFLGVPFVVAGVPYNIFRYRWVKDELILESLYYGPIPSPNKFQWVRNLYWEVEFSRSPHENLFFLVKEMPEFSEGGTY